jgi:hypothetical protein
MTSVEQEGEKLSPSTRANSIAAGWIGAGRCRVLWFQLATEVEELATRSRDAGTPPFSGLLWTGLVFFFLG